MAPLSCRRRWTLVFRVVLAVLLLIGSSAAAKADKPNKPNKKANAATTKKEQQAKTQPQQQKKPQQQKAQQQKAQQKQQKVKRGTQASDATMEDTKENRHYHATRVLQGTPLIETLEGLVQEAARVKGPEAAEVRQMRERGWTEEGVRYNYYGPCLSSSCNLLACLCLLPLCHAAWLPTARLLTLTCHGPPNSPHPSPSHFPLSEPTTTPLIPSAPRAITHHNRKSGRQSANQTRRP